MGFRVRVPCAGLPHLTTIDHSRSKKITDDGLKHLEQCFPNFTRIDLAECSVTEDLVDQIEKRFPNIMFSL